MDRLEKKGQKAYACLQGVGKSLWSFGLIPH